MNDQCGVRPHVVAHVIISSSRSVTETLLYDLLPSQAIMNVVLSSGCVGPDIKYNLCYGLLLKHLKSSVIHWLHPDLTVSELTQRYEQQHLEAEWRSVLVFSCYTRTGHVFLYIYHRFTSRKQYLVCIFFLNVDRFPFAFTYI